MRSTHVGWSVSRVFLGVLTAVLIGYLGLIASWPALREQLPSALRWFGEPNSAVSIGIVVAVLGALGMALTQSRGGRSGAPVAIVAGLALISAFLGMAAYWRCHDDSHPVFFTPLLWTASLVKGGSAEQKLADGTSCPAELPVALDVAQLSALAAVFLSIVGVAMALFKARVDRLRVYFAPAVTAIIDLDDDSKSMVPAIKRTLGPRTTLALITDSPDRPCVSEARSAGARIVTVDFTKPVTLTGLSLWRKLDSLYLLGPDASVNLARLSVLTDHLEQVSGRLRVPLVVRVDDPWQATAWRAKQFGDTHRQWAADAVGRFEATARRLMAQVAQDPAVEKIIVCGASQLTLALCAELSQRQLERDFRNLSSLPDTIVVAEDAADYLADHEYSRRQLGLPHDRPSFTAMSAKPSVPLLMSLIDDGSIDPASVAVILVDNDALSGIGTRLAVRYPATAIYAWDRAAEQRDETGHSPALVGRLNIYQLSLAIPDDQAHDAWELAARLIHERYASPGGSPSTAPWPELSEFYRESNRRQVNNALWMVEKIGGHTWNTAGNPPQQPWSPSNLHGLEPLEQLQVMGFDTQSALRMAQAEHEDWCRFYRRHGWTSGDTRDDAAKVHTNLVDWADIEKDPEKLHRALSSLAATLSKLRELGYRSRPIRDDTTV